MNKILFISHDANRTGAPRSLIFLLRWLRLNSDMQISVLLKDGGVLQSEFEHNKLIGIFNSARQGSKNIGSRIIRRLGFPETKKRRWLKSLKAKLIKEDFDLIYTNTIANGEVLEFLSDFLKCPVICHVRELENMISHHVGTETFEKTRQYTTRYIAVSNAVKDNLIKKHGISIDNIDVIYNAVSDDPAQLSECLQARSRILKDLDIPDNAKVVCASGTTDWRKGPDLFIQLASNVIKKYSVEPIHFIWVGGNVHGPEFLQLQHDIEKAGIIKETHFIGSRSNPLDYYAACDIFTLMSREDPFPRVCLEAASLCKPIVCFNSAGGAPEFVENDCGFVVPYLDISTMADKVIYLLNKPSLREQMGERAIQKVKDNHNHNVVGHQILEVIGRLSRKQHSS